MSEKDSNSKIIEWAGIAVAVALAGVGVWMVAGGGGEGEGGVHAAKHDSGKAGDTDTSAVDDQSGAAEAGARDGHEANKPEGSAEGAEDTDKAIEGGVPPPPRLEWLPNGMAVRYDKKGRKIVVTNPEDYAYFKAQREQTNPVGESKPYFKHRLENELWNFAVPGESVPPLPLDDLTDEEIAAALAETLEASDGDGEEDAYMKSAVQMLKDEMKAFLDEGHSAKEYFREVAARQAKEAELVEETRAMAIDSIENDELDHARELVDRLNEHLKDNGLPPMRLPRRYRRILELSTNEDSEQ